MGRLADGHNGRRLGTWIDVYTTKQKTRCFLVKTICYHIKNSAGSFGFDVKSKSKSRSRSKFLQFKVITCGPFSFCLRLNKNKHAVSNARNVQSSNKTTAASFKIGIVCY